MLEFAANLNLLFPEVGFSERFALARGEGFAGVEFPFPYQHEKERLAELLEAHELELVLHNLPPGDLTRGERGIACLPERRAEFRESVALGIDYAKALGCRRLNCLAGISIGISPAVAFDTLVENLQFAAAALGAADIQLLIEPINTRDMPGFFVNRSAQALAVIDSVGSPNLWLQYDIYHMQVMGEDLIEDIRRCLPKIGHFQLADSPGRHQPGTGEIDYPSLLRHIEQLGYSGWLGCEYHPLGTSHDALSWLQRYRRGEF